MMREAYERKIQLLKDEQESSRRKLILEVKELK